MNMLERFLGHDLESSRELLEVCLTLSDEQLDRRIDAGWGTLRLTFEHMIANIEVWSDLMQERPLRTAPRPNSTLDLLFRLEAAYSDFAAFALQAEREGRLDQLFTDVLDRPPQQKTLGGAIGHLVTHNMHHRAEIQHMLHRVGHPGQVPEGDLMGWDMRQQVTGG
ncbi:MAG: DinB family protein [Anaerolineales bacterium]|nr:DinB family protein [Anaerolineales bacterium]